MITQGENDNRSIFHGDSNSFLLALVFTLFAAPAAYAVHKDGHASEGVGQIDTTKYNCQFTDDSGNSRTLGATECMLAKLDRIERRMGCPLEDYMDGTCPYSPADTTATFCISQGREGGIDAEWGAEAKAEYDLGVGWPNVAWAKAVGKVEHPVPLPLGPIILPLPTEVNVTGAASLGRNLDICIEVPLNAFAAAVGLERNADAEIIDRIVRGINDPVALEKSKFQRRLGRLANYAIARVPGTNRFGAASSPVGVAASAHTSDLAITMGDDGESEFDMVEDAIERLMSGNFEMPVEGGPFALLKSPMVTDLSAVLEIPNPVKDVLDDPDILIGRLFELGSPGTEVGALAGGGVCESFGLNGELQARFEGVGRFCGLLSGLPSFAQTTGIFGVVDTIRAAVSRLPSLAEIKAAACDIAGWNCSE